METQGNVEVHDWKMESKVVVAYINEFNEKIDRRQSDKPGWSFKATDVTNKPHYIPAYHMMPI